MVIFNKKYVLCCKLFGKFLLLVYVVDCEYKVIFVLYLIGFFVVKFYVLCMDESVIGMIFYIMDNVEGCILWDG